MAEKDKITALDRGLEVIDFILREKSPLRFTDIKAILPGVTDATITRLLKALIASHYLIRTETGFYEIGNKLQQWQQIFSNQPLAIEALLKDLVENTALASGCSASFCRLQNDHLEFQFTRNLEGCWSLYLEGGILNFEADHAAAIAYLEMQSQSKRQEFIAGEYSRLSSAAELEKSINLYRRDGYYLDESKARPGLCRMAVPINLKAVQGVLFIGLSITECQIREKDLANILKTQCENFYKKLNH